MRRKRGPSPPGDARSDAEGETQAASAGEEAADATIYPRGATKEAAGAGTNTAIENAAERDSTTRTTAGNEAAAE
ncbi:hypothetical protein DIPPA_27097 [Diplonema papillatum]|nr:hypothetical protein DIPPA_27097 [Diplonema papillatum]